VIDIDTLISDADPVYRSPLASPHSEDAQRLLRQITTGSTAVPRRRRSVTPARITLGAAAVASALALVAVTLPESAVRPPSAAAAVLDHTAVAAAHQRPLVLRPGQYLYWETTGVQSDGYLDLTKAGQIQVLYRVTEQQWIASDGSGREVDRYQGPVEFQTPASERNWEAAGRPASVLETPAGPDGGRLTTSTPAGGALLLHLARLPVEPTALLRVIQAGKTGDPNVEATGHSSSAAFQAAADLLGEPATGTSPALRSALYRVMATLPGAKLEGTVTDHAGQRGLGIAGPGSRGERTQVVVDPATGWLLEVKTVVMDPSAESPGVRKYFGPTAGQVIGWTDYLENGVVDSATSVP
jgi:hypothetical protein